MKKEKIISLVAAIMLFCTGCSYSQNDTGNVSYNALDRSIDTISIDYSGIVNTLPGNNNESYETAEELLGVSSEPTKLVGRYKKETLKEDYEKLATEAYVLWLFENEDKTASEMYKYYFFDNIEDYKAAYDAFCMKNGSPSVKNEKSLFFGNGGSAKLYVQANPKYEDILVHFQADSVEVIKTWDVESPSDDQSNKDVSDAITESSEDHSFFDESDETISSNMDLSDLSSEVVKE